MFVFVFATVKTTRRHIGVFGRPGLRMPLVQNGLEGLHVRVLLLGRQLALAMLVLRQSWVITRHDLALLLPLRRRLTLGSFFAGHQLFALGTVRVTDFCYVPVVVQ